MIARFLNFMILKKQRESQIACYSSFVLQKFSFNLNMHEHFVLFESLARKLAK